MTCLRPVHLHLPGDGLYGSLVPCRRCVVCKENKNKEWFIRILCEVGDCDFSKFVTLTYSDECLPAKGSLDHRHFQLYVKRLRKALSVDGVKLKYYVCGEYGENFGRPHYHAIFMFYNCIDIENLDLGKVLRDCWQFGFVSIGGVTPRSVRYCLSYMKKMFSLPHPSSVVAPYHRVSQGLGESYLNSHEDQLSSKGYISYSGYRYAIPRYFKDKSEKVKSGCASIAEKFRLSCNDSAMEVNFRFRNTDDHAQIVKQVERNISQKKRIKRGSL